MACDKGYTLRWGTFGDDRPLEQGGGSMRLEQHNRQFVSLRAALAGYERVVKSGDCEWVALFLDKRKPHDD